MPGTHACPAPRVPGGVTVLTCAPWVSGHTAYAEVTGTLTPRRGAGAAGRANDATP